MKNRRFYLYWGENKWKMRNIYIYTHRRREKSIVRVIVQKCPRQRNVFTLTTSYLRHPSSVLSIFISRIFDTSSDSTRSNIEATPACCAELRCTVPDARTIPSFSSMERWEKAAISNSFQPALSRSTWSSSGNDVKCGMCLAHETSWNSCLFVAVHRFDIVFCAFQKMSC